MASKNGGKRISSSLIEQFRSVTGADENVGRALLEACGGNLEMAIGMHMDEDGGASTSQPAATASEDEDGENVRAPIPQMTEQLVEETPVFGFRGRRRQAKSVFDGFRDFQAEARQQAAGESSSASKRKTLEDLFRPPIHLMHKGSFSTAREKGTYDNRWLMVNIQNVQEFSCQALNRDVWSNHGIKCLIDRHFVFWQVYHDSEEGKKYTQFYKVMEWPYVAVLDPRTGENMVVWNKVESSSFCDIVSDFLHCHPSPDGTSGSPPTKKQKRSDSIVDANEDSQLNAAIQASLVASSTSSSTNKRSSDQYFLRNSDSDNDDDDENDASDLETFTDSECSDTESQGASSPAKKDRKPPNKTSSKCAIQPEKPAKARSPSPESNSQSSVAPTSELDNGSESTKDSKDSSSMDSENSTDSSNTANNKDSDKKTNSSSTGSCFGSWKDYLGSEEDKKSNLMLRFPDGKRKQLSISSSSKLMALTLYVAEEGYSSEKYELVTNFPKRKLSYLDSQQTLSDTGLMQEAIFVQERA